jgi:hypothetical protein
MRPRQRIGSVSGWGLSPAGEEECFAGESDWVYQSPGPHESSHVPAIITGPILLFPPGLAR